MYMSECRFLWNPEESAGSPGAEARQYWELLWKNRKHSWLLSHLSRPKLFFFDIWLANMSFKSFILFFSYVWRCVFIGADTHRGQERSLGCLELELQAFVNNPTWMLGTKPSPFQEEWTPSTAEPFLQITDMHFLSSAYYNCQWLRENDNR